MSPGGHDMKRPSMSRATKFCGLMFLALVVAIGSALSSTCGRAHAISSRQTVQTTEPYVSPILCYEVGC
eukprot:772976-Prymnesium_polylepis.1